jgi:hypothetical protein
MSIDQLPRADAGVAGNELNGGSQREQNKFAHWSS